MSTEDGPALPGGVESEVAGRITTGFDGGNPLLKSDILKCLTCGSLILPSDQGMHRRYHAVIDSLHEGINAVIKTMIVREYRKHAQGAIDDAARDDAALQEASMLLMELDPVRIKLGPAVLLAILDRARERAWDKSSRFSSFK